MKMILKKFLPLILFAVLLTACSAPSTPQPVSPVPTQAALPSPVASPASLSMGSVSLSSSGTSPDYTIKTDLPVLQGTSPHQAEFNQRVSALVTKETDAFKQNLADWTPVPGMTESSLTLSYTAFPYNARFASIRLFEDFYMAGAAHPSHQMISLVYDLDQGQDVVLSQLFLPGSNYLQVIAAFCKAEILKRNIAFDDQVQGADPSPENYTVWNLSTDGLVITFNEYQVAPYVAGPQTVVIPFDALETVIDPQGPLKQ